jgi:hypothetical protein
MHLFSAVSDDNTDPVIILWWLRSQKRRQQEKRKHWVHPFFRDNLNSCAYIVLKELNHDPELFKSMYRMSTESFFFISGSCMTPNSKKSYKFSYSYVSRRKTADYSQVRKVYLFIAIHILQISEQIQYHC